MNNSLLHEVIRLKAVADTGLLYAKNEYDIERYKEIEEISLRLLSQVSGHTMEALQLNLPLSKDYPTAKVDIRCLILSADTKVLLVRESIDGKWSLPGGWADVGFTPKETAIKECKEETGLDVDVKALLAVFDKKMHPHPYEPFYVYKMVFHCEAVSSVIEKGWDVLEVQYFDMKELPDLSENRILKSQIRLAVQKVIAQDFKTYFD